MTLKQKYENRDRGELRRPKSQPRGVNNRTEASIKNALRNGDVDSFYDEEPYEDEDVYEEFDSD